jgi:hypothetical protein
MLYSSEWTRKIQQFDTDVATLFGNLGFSLYEETREAFQVGISEEQLKEVKTKLRPIAARLKQLDSDESWFILEELTMILKALSKLTKVTPKSSVKINGQKVTTFFSDEMHIPVEEHPF